METITHIEKCLAEVRQHMAAGDVAKFIAAVEAMAPSTIEYAIGELARGDHDEWMTADEVANIKITLEKELIERTEG